jgi:hypothetical protein
MTRADERPAPTAVAAAVLGPAWLLMLIAGAYAAALGHRFGAVLLLAAVLGEIATHLVMGVSEYRRVMSRPWPAVETLGDDDDW